MHRAPATVLCRSKCFWRKACSHCSPCYILFPKSPEVRAVCPTVLAYSLLGAGPEVPLFRRVLELSKWANVLPPQCRVRLPKSCFRHGAVHILTAIRVSAAVNRAGRVLLGMAIVLPPVRWAFWAHQVIICQRPCSKFSISLAPSLTAEEEAQRSRSFDVRKVRNFSVLDPELCVAVSAGLLKSASHGP